MAGFLSPPRIDSLISSADVLRTKKPGSYLNGSISSYTPSVSEGAEQKITGLLSYVMPRREAAKLAHKVASFADFTPVGDAVTAAQAGQDFRQGNILSGLGNTAIAAIGVVPGVGDVAAKGLKKGIRAFHGSPHDFDRFSLSKIGTGEGAQAYGHGLYFAEKPEVAKQYREMLTGRDNPKLQGLAARAIGTDPGTGPDVLVADALTKANDLADFRGRIADHAQRGLQKPADTYANWEAGRLTDALNSGRLDRYFADNFDGARGRMYEVNINADPDSLLDWDKPLGEQNRLHLPKQLGVDPGDMAREPTGFDLMYGLKRKHQGGGPFRTPEISNILLDQGIPGIQYLDQGSRVAGDGSKNFVIFDDSIIDILNKY